MDYLSQNNYIKSFKKKGIQITWGVLLLGIRGVGKLKPLLEIKDIIDVSLDKLLKDRDSKAEVIAFCSDDTDYQSIQEKLLEFSEKEDLDLAEKKWAIILLENTLNELPKEKAIEGLTKLTEFWCYLNYPIYSPHIIQGKGNNLSPSEYYSLSNYNKLIEKHKNWIEASYKNL